MKTIMNQPDFLPYEKYLSLGPEALSDAELLAIILRTGTHNCSALQLSQMILNRAKGKYLGLNGLYHISLEELMQISGIGEVKAVKIKCITELSARMARERAAVKLEFNRAETIAAYYMENMRHLETEQVRLLLLNNKLGLINDCLLSEGTINASLVSAREVFICALSAHACFIMLLHNHPSGDPSPSKQDLLITSKIKAAGELLDILLLDHIILGDNCFFSLKKESLL